MRKLCSSVKCVRLLSCPLTAPAVPQYQRQLLQWGKWFPEDVPCCYSLCQVQEIWSCSASSFAPKCTLCRRGSPAFPYFLFSVLLCILWAQLPSNSVRRAQHFLCPTASAGAVYPVQSSTTSERVVLHPKSIENAIKVFITLSELWTLMASDVRGKAVRMNFMRKSPHLVSDTESQL